LFSYTLFIHQQVQDNHPLMKPYGILDDIGITNITTRKTVVGRGYNVNITIKILNYGLKTQTFNTTVYANTTIIHTIVNITLTSRNSTTITFTWNTAEFAKGNYTLWAYAKPVEGESYTNDNTLIDGNVTVTIPGNVDGDSDVDIYDIVRICIYYGLKAPPPLPDPNCDIDGDGDIDIYDVVAACIHYGEKWP